MNDELDYKVPTDKSLFPKEYKKNKITFTISEKVIKDLDALCKRERLNKSLTIQTLLEFFIENNKK